MLCESGHQVRCQVISQPICEEEPSHACHQLRNDDCGVTEAAAVVIIVVEVAAAVAIVVGRQWCRVPVVAEAALDTVKGEAE